MTADPSSRADDFGFGVVLKSLGLGLAVIAGVGAFLGGSAWLIDAHPIVGQVLVGLALTALVGGFVFCIGLFLLDGFENGF